VAKIMKNPEAKKAFDCINKNIALLKKLRTIISKDDIAVNILLKSEKQSCSIALDDENNKIMLSVVNGLAVRIAQEIKELSEKHYIELSDEEKEVIKIFNADDLGVLYLKDIRGKKSSKNR